MNKANKTYCIDKLTWCGTSDVPETFLGTKKKIVRRGDTGRIMAQLRRPVASRVALDLPYWAMRSEPYCLIRVAIEMAREVGLFFSVVDFMSCVTVAKRPCYDIISEF